MGSRAILLISIIFATTAAAADPIGVRAKGGYPEYLFLEKAPRGEAQATAQKLASANGWIVDLAPREGGGTAACVRVPLAGTQGLAHFTPAGASTTMRGNDRPSR